MEKDKIILEEEDIPDKWYNIHADVDLPPPIHPATHEPIAPDDLSVIFPKALISQEVSKERWISIPDEVRDIYRIWRPTPLYRARRLERFLKTPARIFYKWEGVSPPGSQGCVFGRGNQQISSEVIRTVGVDNIVIASTPHKLMHTPVLFVDTGDAALNRELAGIHQVVVGCGIAVNKEIII